MPLTKQTTVIPVASGVDTGSDPKLGPAGKLVDVTNGYYERTGELRKRCGSENLSVETVAGGSIASTTPFALGTLEGRLVLFNRSGNARPVAMFSETAEKWVAYEGATEGDAAGSDSIRSTLRGSCKVETLREFNGTFRPVGGSAVSLGFATGGGIRMLADGNRVIFTDADGVILSDNTVAAAVGSGAHSTLCVYTGTYFVCLSSYSMNELEAYVWLASDVTATPTVCSLSGVGLASPSSLDIQAYSSTVVRVVSASGGGGSYTIWDLNCATGVTASSTIATGAAIWDISFVRDTAGMGGSHVIHGNTVSGIRVQTLSAARAVTATYTIYAAGLIGNRFGLVGYTQSAAVGHFAGAYTDTSGGGVDVTRWIARSAAGVGFTTANWFGYECHVAGYPVAGGNGDTYFLIRRDSITDPTLFLVRLPLDTDGVPGRQSRAPVARITAFEAASNGRAFIHQTAAGELTLMVETEGLDGTTESYDSHRMVRITLDAPVQGPAELGGSLYMPGGQLLQFDGRRYAELGFPHEPAPPIITQTAAPGALTLTGAYQWCTVYRYVDEAGRTHVSAPSVPTSETMSGANQTVSVDCPTLRVTSRSDMTTSASPTGRVYIDLYRVQAGGTTFNYVASAENNISADTVAITDNYSDASILDNQLLYTTGGILETTPPPPCHAVAVYRGRLFVVDSENPTDVWHSKELEPGKGPEFSDALILRAQQPIVAIIACDDRLILFSRKAVYYIAGDGPDNLGRGVYAPPGLVSSSTGCLSWAPTAVLATPDGVIFPSERGFQLIDRGLSVQDIGKPIQDWDANEYTSGVYLPRLMQSHFFTTDGRTAVFDHHHKVWTTSESQPAQCATVWVNDLAYANAAGVVSAQSVFLNTDNGVAVQMSVTTGWISLLGLEGFARLYELRLLGSWTGTYSVAISYDYDDTVVQTVALSPTDISTMAFKPARQRCSAFKLTITESGPASDGFTLTAIAVQFGAKPRLFSRPTSNRMT